MSAPKQRANSVQHLTCVDFDLTDPCGKSMVRPRCRLADGLLAALYLCVGLETVRALMWSGGLDRLESPVTLSLAPIREVPDVDDRKPRPVQPSRTALSDRRDGCGMGGNQAAHPAGKTGW